MRSRPIVCVIDAVTPAMLASILFRNKKIDVCIIEEWLSPQDKGSNRWYAVNRDERILIDCILSELQIKNLYTMRYPAALGENLKTPGAWIDFFRIKRKIYKFLNNLPFDFHEACFVGLGSSTFLAFLPLSLKIIPLDHGLEVIGRGISQKDGRKSLIRECIKRALGFITKFNYFKHINNQGYTFVNCKNDYFIHVDYKEFKSDVIERILLPAENFVSRTNKRFSLFLPLTQDEFIRFMGGKKDSCRELDFDNIYSCMLSNIPDTDYLVVKFHPGFYSMGDGAEGKYMAILKSICEKKHIVCMGLDEFIGCKFSYALPAEVLVKYIDFENVIGMYSTTMVNIAEKNGKVKCYNISGVVDELDRLMIDKYGYNKLNENIISINMCKEL